MRLDDLPEAYRAQARRQLAAAAARLDLKRKAEPPATRPPRERIGRGPNATESDFNSRFLDGRGLYEAVTFRLPGGSRYTPDFAVWDAEGRLTVYEVKGAYRLPSEGRALTAWREARAAFPLVRFRWFQKEPNGWVERHTN